MSVVALSRHELSRQRATPRGGRIAIAVVVLALAGVFVFFNEAVRSVEGAVSEFVLSSVFSYDVYSWRDQVIFPLGDGHFLALRITVECTSLVVLAPLLLFASAILVYTRVGMRRWLLSVVVAVAIVFAANIVRIVTIAIGVHEFDRVGYDWTHTVIGTGIIAIATIMAVILMLRMQSGKGIPRRRR